MITLKKFVFNPFQENTYVLSDETNSCVIIDPGMINDDEEKEIADYISKMKLIPKLLINTHCHVDHVLGCNATKRLYNIPFYAHESEKIIIETSKSFAEIFGMTIEQPPQPDMTISEKDMLSFGKTEMKIIHVPGHSPGSLVFYSENDKIAISGDVLFRGSIGRTDFPLGDHNLLIQGIKSKLLSLPRETIVYPGHGPSSTIGSEYDTNPFLF